MTDARVRNYAAAMPKMRMSETWESYRTRLAAWMLGTVDDLVADAVQASLTDDLRRHLEAARVELEDYRRRADWETSCGEHARILEELRAEEQMSIALRKECERLRAELRGGPDE